MEQATERLAAALSDRYRLERELGQGGMATVYLAEDLRHHRRVAIKVLHPELSALLGSERFLKEIELTANLQHPHILPLFDSGSADGLLYYVMPFVEGETLRKRMVREHQLPIADAVRITTEVADALEYAHKRAVVHRDIKPENILLHDGRPLVADFGIALAVQQAGGTRMTQTGMSLGTPQYMAPEQAMGEKGVDHRADIYALGAVAYEMLAGEPPFTGPTSQAIVAKVMTEEPKGLMIQRRSVPEAVEAAVLTALEKLPADRFATAAAFAAALGAGSGAAVGIKRRVPVASRRRNWIPVAAATLGALALGTLAGMRLRPAPDSDAAPARFEIATLGLGFTPFRTMSLSPDGRHLVYFVRAESIGLYVRPIDQLESRSIPGTENVGNPSIGLDGREMLMTRYGQVYRMPLAGGDAVALPDVPQSPFNALNEAGDVIYTGTDGGTWRLPRKGRPVRVSAPDTAGGERSQLLLDLLPGGRTALIGGSGGTGFTGKLYALDIATGAKQPLLDVEVRGAAYAGRNTLVYVTGDQMIHGIRFDPDALTISGESVPLGGPAEAMPLGNPRMSVSRTGMVVYAPRNPAELVLVDREGRVRPLLDRPAEYHNPRFSPDGRSVSVDILEPTGRDVWVQSLDQGTLTRVTFDNDGHDAIWSRDGRSLVYVATRNGRIALLRTRLDGSPGEQLSPDPAIAPGAWTADGRLLAVAAGEEGREGYNIIVDSAGRLRPFLATRFSEGWPATSPDGRWIAYVSDASRRYEVYLSPVDGSSGRIQVSVDGGSEPVWSADGRELYYRRTGTFELVAARLELGATPRVISRESLFGIGDFVGAEPHANYDVAADGRMVMVRRTQAPKLVLIQNVDRLVQGQ